VVDGGLYGWHNSRVIHSFHAPEIAAAADAVVSASGYNGFHEAMYNRVPTIFVPQMAPYMDDQRARAEAAARRGLAKLVEADDLLALRRALHELLDGEAAQLRAALMSQDLPPTGTAEAARIIHAEAGA
jgi:UDP:flavonoid glycosyltransferase YjiC (YdhE family)